MKENQFTVDLGNLKLSAVQRKNINTAIQKAVTSELSKAKLSNKIVLIPVDRWPKGPIINGIIARPVNDKIINSILR